MHQSVVWKTVDPVAISWFRDVQARNESAVRLVRSIGKPATELVGPGEAGELRSSFAVERKPNSLTVTGVMAEVHEMESPPQGTRLKNGVLVPDLQSEIGVQFADLLAKHSTSGIIAGHAAAGVSGPVTIDGDTFTGQVEIDQLQGALFQVWSGKPEVVAQVESAITNSEVEWIRADPVEVLVARDRNERIAALRQM